jgi:RNA polymerase sigma-70 factor (ECF subfamily)
MGPGAYINETISPPMIQNLATRLNVQEHSDEEIIARVLQGDKELFRTLITRHKDKVRNLVYLTIGNADNVDDISQEVFIKVYRKLDRFKGDSKFTTWLYRITVNHCKDELRKYKVRKVFDVFDRTKHEDLRSTNSAENFDTKDRVRLALSKLPEKLRIPIVLKDIEGFGYQEIAEMLDCELGTIKSRIFRARESLRAMLQPYMQ